jgi:hypothetical protein
MNPASIPDSAWSQLAAALEGELRRDHVSRTLYATDASVYREMPLAVVFPRHEEDVKRLVAFARTHGTSLIPRTAGTSLAGQVVGAGLVVDVSRHFTRILEIDATARTVRVQPGVVRNELNLALLPHGLQFAPETSTQNRAMIGGMVGNNSCGANSVIYGSTRDHLLGVRAILSDGSVAEFSALAAVDFQAKCTGGTLEHSLYRHAHAVLAAEANRAGYPPAQHGLRARSARRLCALHPGRAAVQFLPAARGLRGHPRVSHGDHLALRAVAAAGERARLRPLRQH